MSENYVLYVTQFLKHREQPGQTGGTLSNYLFIKTLSGTKKVRILSFDSNEDVVGLFKKYGIDVHASPAPAWNGLSLLLHWNKYVQEKITEFIEKYGYPSEIITTTSTVPGLKCVKDVPSCRKFVIIRAYENFGFLSPKVSRSARISFIKHALITHFTNTRMIRNADIVVTNSDFMRQAILKRFGTDVDRIKIVPQLCDMMKTDPLPLEQVLSVGFVARGSEKNLPFVLKIAGAAPDISFLIYGHTSEINQTLPPNVHIMGWCSDRRKMIGSASVWLMPSVWAEPFGRVSMEAQAGDRISLVIDSGGLPETVIDSQFVVSEFNVNLWVRKIREVLEIPLSSIQENGEKIRAKFSQLEHDTAIKKLFE